MSRKNFLAACLGSLVIISAGFVAGCGYTTRGFTLPGESIFIAPIINAVDITSDDKRFAQLRTNPLLLEKQLLSILANKFTSDGHIRLVDQESAQLTLKAVITDYVKQTLRRSGDDDVEEEEIRLVVHVVLTDKTGKNITDTMVTGVADYYLSGAQARTEASAQRELAEDTARRILEAVTEQW